MRTQLMNQLGIKGSEIVISTSICIKLLKVNFRRAKMEIFVKFLIFLCCLAFVRARRTYMLVDEGRRIKV